MTTEINFLLFYFLILIGIGIWAMRRGAGKGLEGYLLGGRSMGPAVTALTLQSTSMSGYMFLGAGSLAYTQGYWSLWYALGDLGGGVLNMSVLGRRMRKLSQILGAVTSIEYLERRYPSALTRIIAAPLALICLFFYVLAQFIAGGKGLALVTGFSYPLALGIAIGVIVLYTFLGGYLAVAYTDFFQAIIMLIGVLWILFAALATLGGLGTANARIGEIDSSLLTMWGKDLANYGQWGLIIGALLVFSIGYLGWPHVVVRHMAMKRPSVARKAGGYAMLFNILFVPAPYLVGIVALLIVPIGTDPEMAIFATAQLLLPPAVVGIVMAGIMAAIMSTADSILLQAGTIASRDIYHRFVNKKMNAKNMVRVSRGMVLALAIVGFFIAVFQPPAVFALVIFATTILGSAFVPCYVAAVWWKKTNTVGAVSSMIVGTAVPVVWEIFSLVSRTGLDSMLVGIVSSVTAMIVGSLLTQTSCPVPAHIQAALGETERLGPIPAELFKGQDVIMAAEASVR